jgi:hypothetical protein
MNEEAYIRSLHYCPACGQVIGCSEGGVFLAISLLPTNRQNYHEKESKDLYVQDYV